MVLRILLLIIICYDCFANDAILNRIQYQRMVELYEKGDLDQALIMLKTNYDLNRSDISNDIMFLAAAIYHKSGQSKKALETLNFVIKKSYYAHHQKIVPTYKKQGNASGLEDTPKGLVLLYLQKALIYIDILKENYSLMDENLRSTLIRMVRMGSDLALEVGHKEDFADALLATLNQLEKDFQDQKISKNWFTGLHYITWRDEITLLTQSNAKIMIRTTNSGMMAILGKRYANAYHEWSYAGGYALADATVGNDNPTVNYFQSGVASSLLAAMAAWHWRPYESSISIGAEGMLAFRSGDYEEPTNSNGIEDKSKITLGALASIKWRLEQIEIQTKIGKLLGMPSSIVSFGILYNFK